MADTVQDQALDRDRPAGTAELAAAGNSTESLARGDAGADAAASTPDAGAAPLFPENEAGELRRRWDSVQASFVDEPRRAVEQADELVANAMKRLAETFANERAALESQWDRGDSVSTEDLRLALQRYRSFFGRLLAV